MPKKMEYVTAIEAARLTGLSERTIRRKISTGVLKADMRIYKPQMDDAKHFSSVLLRP